MGEMCRAYFDCLNSLIKKGDHKAVERYLIEKEIKPEAYYEYFRSNFGYKHPNAVGLAAKHGNVKVLKTMFDMGFSLDGLRPGIDIIHPVYMACEGGSVDVLKMFVEKCGVDITNSCHYESESRSAMCVAADHGHIQVLKYLFDCGISPDHRCGESYEAALHAAADNDQDETCKFLLSEGADVNLLSSYSNTPLMLAARNGFYTSAKVLLDAGALTDLVNDDEETAFYLAAQDSNLGMMKLLHSYGADPEISNNLYLSPLHIAVELNNYDMTFFLVNELNVTLRPTEYYRDDCRGETVCSAALEEGNYDMVPLLINAGFDATMELEDFEERDEEEEDEDFDQFLRTKEQPVTTLPFLKQMIARPRSLMLLSILTVRRVLGKRLPVDLKRLPLPEILKKHIVACGERVRTVE